MSKRKSRKNESTRGQTSDTSHVIDIEEAQENRRRKRQQENARKKRQKRREEKEELENRTASSTPEKRKKKRKRKVTTKRLLIILITVAVLSFLSITGVQVFKLNKELALAKEEKARKEQQKEKLEIELARINDDEYIESQARERLRMIRQGEILYVFPEKEVDTSE